MGIPVSILLVTVGAILAFAVNRSPNGINVHAVGWILMIIGLAGIVLTMFWWESWWGRGAFRRTEYADPGVVRRRRVGPRRRTVVHEEAQAPLYTDAGDPPLRAPYVEEEVVERPAQTQYVEEEVVEQPRTAYVEDDVVEPGPPGGPPPPS
jgi:Domain of unknown function (DUF6458)